MCSIHFSSSVMSNFLNTWTAARHTSCLSPTPRAYWNSCPLSRWCHATISSSVGPFSCFQSYQHQGLFQWVSSSYQLAKIVELQPSASVLPMNIQDWFPLGWTGWISLLSKGLSRVFSNTTVQSINSSVLSFLYSPTLTSIPDYWKNHISEYMVLCWQSNVSAS